MNKFLILGLFLSLSAWANAQNTGQRVVTNAKTKSTTRVETKADETVDQALDKIEDGIGSLFKKKEKPAKTQESGSEEKMSESSEDAAEGTSGSETSNGGTTNPSLRSYSKFDFVPGENVIAIEDFSQDAIGDFPAKWNTTSSGEIVTITGLEGNWLAFKDEGELYPEFLEALPENCTIEFDLGVFNESQAYTQFLFLDENNGHDLLAGYRENGVEVGLEARGMAYVRTYDAYGAAKIDNDKPQKQYYIPEGEDYTFVRVSIWKQKSRLRVYLNEEKIWDIPRAFVEEGAYRFMLGSITYYHENKEFLLSNLRFAVGAPDTRSKLITEGKFTTQGIVFDSGSATIKPESAGVFKEIATVLQENPTIQIEIIGHTDSDGDDSLNLALSKKRADAVKNALNLDFGIDGSRMTTDGKGESLPLGDNKTAVGKAQNRRVEFIKK
ncbi:OmpA family protein [Algoriphagus litoralis]|uniref:OmpA family protein n=1 Tax=Algoriphagus litoralis TaxID=2202829 RepID=UPI000DBABC87|nr:OmpA family protein [Algoriphagus litoralis]